MSDAMLWLESCSELLWNVAWKGTLLLATAWAVDRVWLQRRLLGADMLWTATLLGLLVLPLGVAVLPQTMVPVWRAPAAAEMLSQETASSPLTPIALPNHPPANNAHESTGKQASPLEPVAPISEPTLIPFTWPSPRSAAALIYLSGCSLFLARLVLGIASITALVKRTTTVHAEAWLRALAARQAQLGVRRCVRLLSSEEASIPFTIGWLRPTIVVPTDVAATADEATIDATLLHELTHIARGDYPVHLAGKLVEACYWWNPLGWLATARLNAVRESICDGYCCWRMGDCERYGHVLLTLAGRLSPRRVGGVGLAMARGSRLGKRLESLSASSLRNHSFAPRWRFGLVLAIVATSFFYSSIMLGTEKPASANLPDLIATVKQAEASIENLTGSFRWRANNRDSLGDDVIRSKPTTTDVTIAFQWQRDGRERMDAECGIVVSDGQNQTHRSTMTSVYNGDSGWWCSTHLKPDGQLGQSHGFKVASAKDLSRPGPSPCDFTLRHGARLISEWLASEHANIVRIEAIDERPTAFVEVGPMTIRLDENDSYRGRLRFWIDVERGVTVRREACMLNDETDEPAFASAIIECRDYRELLPGVWLPMTVNQSTEPLAPGEAYRTGQVEITEWHVNADISPAIFEEEFPANAAVLHPPAPVLQVPAPATTTDAEKDEGATSAAIPATPSVEAAVDSKIYPDPPKLAYLAWELAPSKDGPQLSRAWNLRGEETDEPLSTGTFEVRGKTYKPHAWNWADDTLRLHAHPLVLWFEDGAPFANRPTMVAVIDAAGKRHSRSQALTRRVDNRIVSVAVPEKPFAWPAHVDLLTTYPIEATQTIKELEAFSDQPIKVAEGVDWMGRVEPDGRFASTLIIWRKPGDEDRTSYGATLFMEDGARFRNDAGGVVRTFDDHQEWVEWYAGVLPEAIARVKISRQRQTTTTIEDVPIRLDLLPKN